jgi:hypothetical protein
MQLINAYVLRQCKAWYIQKAVRVKLNTSNTDVVLFGNVFIGEMKIGNISGYLIQKRIGTMEGTWRKMILFTEGIMTVWILAEISASMPNNIVLK